MTHPQQRIIPSQKMTIVTTSGLAPRMEVTVTRPAFKTPKPSREDFDEDVARKSTDRENKKSGDCNE